MEGQHKSLAEYLPHVGKRKLKSVLAVLAGFFLWQMIRLVFPGLEVHPIFIYIYGIIEIRDSSDKTVNLGRQRIKATFVGLGIGLPMLLLSNYLQQLLALRWMQVGAELILILAGVLLALLLAEKLNCRTFCGVAAIIFVVMMVSHSDGQRYLYAVLRAVQTILGVFVAWLINVKWFPYPGPEKQ